MRTLSTVNGRGAAYPAGLLITAVYTATIFSSAVLIFWIEPLFPKMILPAVGGTAATWVTALMFYQAALLLGYLYSFLLTRRGSPRRQAAIHLAVFALAAMTLPPTLHPPSAALAGWPVLQVLAMLTAGIGAPLFVLSATAPLVQQWFTHTAHEDARDPFFLYVASNVGSLGALIAYPVLVEPNLGVAAQTHLWAAGFAVLAALILGSAMLARTSAPAVALPERAPVRRSASSVWPERALWLLLAAVPSSLLSGTTTKIATAMSSGPLFWVLPLAIYLLTYALAFARRRIVPVRLVMLAQPVLLAPLVLEGFGWKAVVGAWPMALAILALLFVSAYICHRRLAESRPAAERTTEFYLCVALGGLVGGAFNAIVAPSLFQVVAEYPLALVLAMALRPGDGDRLRLQDLLIPLGLGAAATAALWLSPAGARGTTSFVVSVAFAVMMIRLATVPVRLAAGLGVAFLVGSPVNDPAQYHARNFYGLVRVLRDPAANATVLYNGATIHGIQSLDPARRDEPTTYYHRRGPLGDAIGVLGTERPLGSVAAIGLGAGTIACYASGDSRWTFYEINPVVIDVARDPRYFSFLADCRPEARLRLGDGRLLLATEPGRFDLIVLDAFSSDAVPAHLLTVEAFSSYLGKLAPGGMIVANISNRYLDLGPILAGAAARLDLAAVQRFDPTFEGLALGSTWLVMARSPETLGPLLAMPGWRRLTGSGEQAWTDDRSDLLRPLWWHWRGGP